MSGTVLVLGETMVRKTDIITDFKEFIIPDLEKFKIINNVY